MALHIAVEMNEALHTKLCMLGIPSGRTIEWL